MKKPFAIIFLLLGMAFIAVTILKVYPGRPAQSGKAVSQKDTGNADLIEFWEYYNRATTLRLDGQPAKAAENYRLALELKPRHQNTLYYLGNVQLMAGNFEDARNTWSRLIESHKASARGHSQLGNLYSCRQERNHLYDLVKAADHYEKASQLNREETGPLLQLAKIDLVNDRGGEATQKLDDVLSSNFRSAEAFFLLGYVKWKEGQKERARELLKKAQLLKRGNNTGPSNVGEGETKSGASPMLVESFRCHLFSTVITRLIRDFNDVSPLKGGNIYTRFDAEVNHYRELATEAAYESTYRMR